VETGSSSRYYSKGELAFGFVVERARDQLFITSIIVEITPTILRTSCAAPTGRKTGRCLPPSHHGFTMKLCLNPENLTAKMLLER
jgi:hypothetical protein